MVTTRVAIPAALVLLCGVWIAAEQPRETQLQSGAAPTASPQGRGQGGRGGRGGPTRPRLRKVVLAWADTRNGLAQHDSVSHALAVIERLGYESGAYDTFIRTDSNIVAKQPVMTTGEPASGGPSLATVDAIFFLGHRNVPLDPQQKTELAAFVHDEGKGFVAAHTALTSFDSWPEFGELLGGRYEGHPWNTVARDARQRRPHISRHQAFASGMVPDGRVLPAERILARQDSRASPTRCQKAATQCGVHADRRRLPHRMGEDLRQRSGLLFIARPRRKHVGQPRRLPYVLRGASVESRSDRRRRDAATDAPVSRGKAAPRCPRGTYI